jgi:hypothetical protein
LEWRLFELTFGKVIMKKLFALLMAAALGWTMTAGAQVFGVAFGRPGISVAVAAPVAPVYYGYAPAYYAPAPVAVAAPAYVAPAPAYYPAPYYYGGYSSGYAASVTIAPYWGFGWGWGGCGWHGGYCGWHGGYCGGSFHGGGFHGGGGGHGGHH